MTNNPDRRRGPYSKGLAKRKEILRAALALYAESAGARPTLRAIADAVGLSEPGVLHYFDTMDDMLIAVLAERDNVAAEHYNMNDLDEALAYLASTTKEPGLTQLFVDMSVMAAVPDHPAAEFMRQHREQTAMIVGRLLHLDPEDAKIRLVVAAAEGLQLQWLADRSIDVAGDLRQLIDALCS